MLTSAPSLLVLPGWWWQVADAGFAGAEDGLGAIGDLKLGEDVGDVVADRLRSQAETVRDLRVGEVLFHEHEHFVLALGELGQTSS